MKLLRRPAAAEQRLPRSSSSGSIPAVHPAPAPRTVAPPAIPMQAPCSSSSSSHHSWSPASPRLLAPCHAFAALPSGPFPEGTTDTTAAAATAATSATSAAALAEALAWRPRLPPASELLCALIAAAVTATAAVLLPPSSLRLPTVLPVPPAAHRVACLALLFAVLLSWMRGVLLERLYYDQGKPAHELGDQDSHFSVLCDGTIEAHYKSALWGSQVHNPDRQAAKDRLAPAAPDPQNPAPERGAWALHCYHGFGANLYSFDPVLRRLSAAVPALVTSHDMPGFGLTSRPRPGPAYFLTTNGRLGRQVQDLELRKAGLLPTPAVSAAGSQLTKASWGAGSVTLPPQSPGASSVTLSSLGSQASLPSQSSLPADAASQQAFRPEGGSGVSSSGSLAALEEGAAAAAAGAGARVKRVLVGHSMGCICAALQVCTAVAHCCACAVYTFMPSHDTNFTGPGTRLPWHPRSMTPPFADTPLC